MDISADQIAISKNENNSPWSKLPSQNVIYSLEEVMSEQLASDLHNKEVNKLKNTNKSDDQDITEIIEKINLEQESLSKIDNDLILAQLLQLEYDKEFDELIKAKEDSKNKNSRITISYDKFKSVHPVNQKQEKEINELNKPELSSSSDSEDEIEKIVFKNGISGKGENMISKHDLLLNGRHNASKVINLFPPEFETGDSHGIDLRLSNKVYNTLKLHSINEEKRSNRLGDKHDRSTSEISLDPKTRLILFKLINSDIIDSIGGIISTGKEATILYAPGGKSLEVIVPKECVAKVYKTTLNEFKTREKYIAEDYRFKDRYKHLNPQKIVKLWAEKEMHNLMKMKKFDIPCPEVIMLKKHVLIMSFIGSENVPAPKLKDVVLNEQDLKSAYEQSIQILKDLYHKCNLVHADFNQFNLLWHENRVWVIDVSQSVEPINPMGYEFLLRDCQNVFKFFTNRKLESVKTGEQIFNEVTGMNFKGEGEYFLSQIHKYYKDKQIEMNLISKNENKKDEFNFDYYFDSSLKSQKNSVKKQIYDEQTSNID